MLNVIEAFRKLVASNADGSMRYSTVANLLDNIEAEIAEKYMLLPVDADGVPIHVGDVIEYGCNGERLEVTHIGLTKHGDPTVAYRRPNGTLDASCIGSECRHCKPRTLEDVLQSAGVSVAMIEDVAAEIKELLKVVD